MICILTIRLLFYLLLRLDVMTYGQVHAITSDDNIYFYAEEITLNLVITVYLVMVIYREKKYKSWQRRFSTEMVDTDDEFRAINGETVLVKSEDGSA
jgi:hypothetical protein